MANFLLLQGVCSPFFRLLARALKGDGHTVGKLAFTGGDVASSFGIKTVRCNVPSAQLLDFFRTYYRRESVTDIVVFGDTRPVHVPAIQAAKASGVRVHVFEEGYFRPYWVTLERGGVNGRSVLPTCPEWFKEAGRLVPHYGDGRPFHAPFVHRAWHDVVYHCNGVWNTLLFSKYKSHIDFTAPQEYWAYVRSYLRRYRSQTAFQQIVTDLLSGDKPFYLLPLQLAYDSQIRHNSRFRSVEDVIDHVVQSFARHAPAQTYLVVKAHPLDPGFVDHAQSLMNASRAAGVEHRVVFIEAGAMPHLLDRCSGVVCVNSTVGASALIHGRKTVALGAAIYDLPGLTFQGGLDDFWTDASSPDMVLLRRFRDVVIHTTQINGGFYSGQGMAMLVDNCKDELYAPESALERLIGMVAGQTCAFL